MIRLVRASRILLLVLGIVSCPLGSVSAKVFASQNQALSEAFPEASRVDRKTHILRKRDVTRIEKLVREKIESKIVVIHTAWDGDRILGHAHIDVHNVRTQPEASLIVLTPEGSVRSVRILAFHEPLDYMPAERWYAQFEARSLEEPLRVGGDVHGIVGATLSARATARGVRRALAFYEVLVRTAQQPPADE